MKLAILTLFILQACALRGVNSEVNSIQTPTLSYQCDDGDRDGGFIFVVKLESDKAFVEVVLKNKVKDHAVDTFQLQRIEQTEGNSVYDQNIHGRGLTMTIEGNDEEISRPAHFAMLTKKGTGIFSTKCQREDE